jgi:hypothetical protein
LAGNGNTWQIPISRRRLLGTAFASALPWPTKAGAETIPEYRSDSDSILGNFADAFLLPDPWR